MEAINTFTGDHRWLSNFWPCEVTFEGVVYPSSEHAYTAGKTLDPLEREQIRVLATPAAAKRFGRKVKLRPNWNVVRLEVMLAVLRSKFEDPALRHMLHETGDADLVEGNTWNDTFWGVCRGNGKNQLGRLLMQVREETRQGVPLRHT